MDPFVQIDFKKKKSPFAKYIPLSLALVVFLLDQITKLLVEKYIPLNTVGISLFGDFFRIIHVTNKGVAFSLGYNFQTSVRHILFALLPLVILIIVIITYIKDNDFTQFQRWMIAGIVGGGFGNIFDRFFRPNGVVDFLDFKFYGIFGFDRWPTFNIADMSVLICGVLLFISFLSTIINESKKKKTDSDNEIIDSAFPIQ